MATCRLLRGTPALEAHSEARASVLASHAPPLLNPSRFSFSTRQLPCGGPSYGHFSGEFPANPPSWPVPSPRGHYMPGLPPLHPTYHPSAVTHFDVKDGSLWPAAVAPPSAPVHGSAMFPPYPPRLGLYNEPLSMPAPQFSQYSHYTGADVPVATPRPCPDIPAEAWHGSRHMVQFM